LAPMGLHPTHASNTISAARLSTHAARVLVSPHLAHTPVRLSLRGRLYPAHIPSKDSFSSLAFTTSASQSISSSSSAERISKWSSRGGTLSDSGDAESMTGSSAFGGSEAHRESHLHESTTSASALGSERLVAANRLRRFHHLLAQPNVDLGALRRLAWNGIPMSVRPVCWRLLLGYLSTNMARRAQALTRKRSEYLSLAFKHFPRLQQQRLQPSESTASESTSLVAHEASASGDEDESSELAFASDLRDTHDEALLTQIRIDVRRTFATHELFRMKRIRELLTRVLYLWSIRHPATSYVQGLNDLVTPFVLVFLAEEQHLVQPFEEEASSKMPDTKRLDATLLDDDALSRVEADAYWCLTRMLSGIQDNYTFAQPGIQRLVFQLRELVLQIDPALASHLESQNIRFIEFTFRWMNCLLMRELPVQLIVRMWDTYMSEGETAFSTFHLYVCLTFLLHWSPRLKQSDFQEMMMFLQHLPTTEWTHTELETILSQAFLFQSKYANQESSCQ